MVRSSGIDSGLCHVMALHATAGIIINENADPNIGIDSTTALDKNISDHDAWLHDRIDNNAGPISRPLSWPLGNPSHLRPGFLDGDWEGFNKKYRPYRQFLIHHVKNYPPF